MHALGNCRMRLAAPTRIARHTVRCTRQAAHTCACAVAASIGPAPSTQRTDQGRAFMSFRWLGE